MAGRAESGHELRDPDETLTEPDIGMPVTQRVAQRVHREIGVQRAIRVQPKVQTGARHTVDESGDRLRLRGRRHRRPFQRAGVDERLHDRARPRAAEHQEDARYVVREGDQLRLLRQLTADIGVDLAVRLGTGVRDIERRLDHPPHCDWQGLRLQGTLRSDTPCGWAVAPELPRRLGRLLCQSALARG
ncbi:MAG: hypothetical protein E6G26_00220 [Actinobacteria bacterium]|nr:MAG: hypothetical protein E6G26_00220 [Actinomycetota bacterium]